MRVFYSFLLILLCVPNLSGQTKYLDKEGYISFYSEAPVENIEAQNNQVFSLLDLEKGEIKVQLLIKSFLFEKALMREHFNENYMESHKFPKATFKGNIQNWEGSGFTQTDVEINGVLTIRNIENPVQLKAEINNSGNVIYLKGNFNVKVKDFGVKIPMSVVNNIAEEVLIQFELQHKPYNR